MRFWVLIAGLLMAGPALADYWSGDDVGYGRPTPSNPCDCAPGEDGIDWNGDGMSNAADAPYAPKGAYTQGNPGAPETPGAFAPFCCGARGDDSGEPAGTAERGHGSSDGGRGPDRHK